MDFEPVSYPILDADDAVRRAEELLDSDSPASVVESLRDLQERFPREARLYHVSAVLLETLERYGEAEADYRKALLLGPGSDAEDVMLDLAELYLAQERCRECEELLMEVISAAQASPRALALLADVRADLGEMIEAESLLRQALAAEPSASWIARRLAEVLAAGGKHEEMLEVMEQVVAFEPELGVNHGYLGDALKALGRLDEAAAAFRRALELDPEYAWAGRELCDLLASRGEAEAAQAILLKLLDQDPLDPYNLGYLGDFLRKAGRLSESMESFRTALWLMPEYSWAAWQLAGLLCEMNEPEQARQVLYQSLQAEPDDPWTLTCLGCVERSAGRDGVAEDCFERALRIDGRLDVAFQSLLDLYLGTGRHLEARALLRRFSANKAPEN